MREVLTLSLALLFLAVGYVLVVRREMPRVAAELIIMLAMVVVLVLLVAELIGT